MQSLVPSHQSFTKKFLKRGAKLRYWAWGAGTALVLALLAGAWLLHSVLPYAILCPGRTERWAVYHACVPADFRLRAEDIWVETEPGLWLRGWFVRTELPSRGTVLLLHGSSSCKESMLNVAKLLATQGFNSLLYDSRAHGESGGTYCTFGFYERRDCSRFLDEAERRFGSLQPLAIFGNSLGGAIALQTMAVEPRIRCGIVESPFASLREVVRDYMEHYSGVPFAFISNLALARASELAHFPVDEVCPEEAARHIRQPVLVAHGTQDHWIAFRQGERIARNLTAPGCRWLPIPGADHENLGKIGGAEYQRVVAEFLTAYNR